MRFIKNKSKNINNNGQKYKTILNSWDVFINWSLDTGNSHFAVTINLPDYDPDDLKNLNKNNHNDKEFYNNVLNEYLIYFLDYPRISTWFFIISEENKRGVLHIHGILAIRNLTDYNLNIKNNILDKIKTHKYLYQNPNTFPVIDVVIKNLDGFLNIKKWVMYLHKTKMIFIPRLYIIETYFDIAYNFFWYPYLYDNDYNSIDNDPNSENYGWCNSTDTINPGFEIYSVEKKTKIKNDNKLITTPTSNILGCRIVNNKISQETFIDLILYYIILNDLYIYKNNIYEKIENSLISYRLKGTIIEELYNKFEDNIIPFFLKNYECHFKNFNFYFLIKFFKIKIENTIEKIKELTKNKINPNFNLMEFKDGIYDISNNRFIKKNNINTNNNKFYNLSTLKYYNQYYSWVRQNEPTYWINGLKNSLDIPIELNLTKFIKKKENFFKFDAKINNFIVICLFISTLFQENKNKKKFLFLHGKSNTGKTTYINKILSNFFLNENIGTIISDNNFTFQDLENKLLIIIDEFKYNPRFRGEFLKILGGEDLLISKKYSKTHINLNNSKGVILSNSLFFERDDNINEALYNRLYVVEFIKKIIKNNDLENIDQKLKKEEANIYIYCNKLYFFFLKNLKFMEIPTESLDVIENKNLLIKSFYN